MAVRYRADLGWDVRPAHSLYRLTGTDLLICQCDQRSRCTSPGKHPTAPYKTTPPWSAKRLQAAYSYNSTGRYWTPNVCILLGNRPDSTCLVVADIDPRHGGKLETLWDLGWSQDTCAARSGAGGWHVYAQCPAGGLPSVDNYAPGIEFKANGKLVIAPPSLHTSLHLYKWVTGHDPWILPPALLPDSVIADVRARKQPAQAEYVPLTAEQRRQLARQAPGLVEQAVLRAQHNADGGRHNTMKWLTVRLWYLGLPKDARLAHLRVCQDHVQGGWDND
jgi:hypothetical protein